MSSELSKEDVFKRDIIKQNKNLLKLYMIQKILEKHGLPNTCPVKEIVSTTVNPDSITVKRTRPLQQGGNTNNTTHIHVKKGKGNKVDFVVTD